MEQREVKKILTKQLELLSEKSKDANIEELCKLSAEIANLYLILQSQSFQNVDLIW